MIPLELLSYLAWGTVSYAVVRGDLRERKIRNKWLVLGAAACAVCYGLHLLLSLGGHFGWATQYFVRSFYQAALIHMAASFLAAMALWFCEIWPAGDAKFFLVCAAFLPLLDPRELTAPRYIFLRILVNTFVLAAAYVLLDAVARGARAVVSLRASSLAQGARLAPGRAAAAARAWAGRWKENAALVVNMAGLFAGQILLRRLLADQAAHWLASPGLIYVALFLLWEKLDVYFSSRRLAALSGLVVAAGGLAGLLWSPAGVWRAFGSSLSRFTAAGLLVIALRLALEWLLRSRATRLVDHASLEPGMIPSRQALALLRRDPEYYQEHFTPLFKDGLSAAQAEALRQWLMGLPPGQGSIEVSRGIPFGVWIFAGCLLTLALRQDAAHLLLSLLRP